MSEPFDGKSYVKNVPTSPGIYQMFDAKDVLLYVGKARDLKKRLSSYFREQVDREKTRRLVEQIQHIEITVTQSETEALLLENALIKQHRPRYNILLRDDKSYPYIFVSQEAYPRIAYHRGEQKEKGRYFGPYPSGGDVRRSLRLIQKLFPVRQCENAFFQHRSRPCLQYQIKRCTAPCVDLISHQEYAKDVADVMAFLDGKNDQLINGMAARMDAEAQALNFEGAARIRDQISALRTVLEKQAVHTASAQDIDVMGMTCLHGIWGVNVIFIRKGQLLGVKNYFPRVPKETSQQEFCSEFISRFYAGQHQVPNELILSADVAGLDELAHLLSELVGRRVAIQVAPRKERAVWQKMALNNIELAIEQRAVAKQSGELRFYQLQQMLEIKDIPQRIECFDISHHQGANTIASCVVFNRHGPDKKNYRRFTIREVTGGDDYAAMKQAMGRRYKRLKDEDKSLPDIILADGGKGQLAQLHAICDELELKDIILLSIAKGPQRKSGLETIWRYGEAIPLNTDSYPEAFHLLQHVRDEAHRFAITGHRKQKTKAGTQSVLETIEGIGPAKRKALLNHFGGMQKIKNASIDELCLVQGINASLAQKIFEAFHR
jgi:excinuclease ABC subunit C